MPVYYEWDIETVDQYGDCQDHNHDSLPMLVSYKHDTPVDGKDYEKGSRYQLVLVRDVCNSNGDLKDREWAYVENNELPTQFTYGAKVPQKYLKEFNKLWRDA